MNTLPVNITAATRTTTAYRYRISLALSALCLPALISISGASSAATAYLGWVTDSTTDPYVNRCAINAASSISTLPTNPNYVMAYRSGADSCSSYAPTTGYGMIHRQGIQRLTRDGQNYLLVTMSTKNGTPDSTGAGFRTAWVDLWRVDLNASYVPTLHVHAGRVQRSQARTKCALARAESIAYAIDNLALRTSPFGPASPFNLRLYSDQAFISARGDGSKTRIFTPA